MPREEFTKSRKQRGNEVGRESLSKSSALVPAPALVIRLVFIRDNNKENAEKEVEAHHISPNHLVELSLS